MNILIESSEAEETEHTLETNKTGDFQNTERFDKTTKELEADKNESVGTESLSSTDNNFLSNTEKSIVDHPQNENKNISLNNSLSFLYEYEKYTKRPPLSIAYWSFLTIWIEFLQESADEPGQE